MLSLMNEHGHAVFSSCTVPVIICSGANCVEACLVIEFGIFVVSEGTHFFFSSMNVQVVYF